MKPVTKIVLLVVLVVSTCLLLTEVTDADLFDEEVVTGNKFMVTTLDFSTRDTANLTIVNSLFRTINIVRGGFEVRAVRLKKDGQLDIPYHLAASIISSSSPLCSALKLKIIKQNQFIYNDKLSLLNLDGKIEGDSYEDYIFILYLDQAEAEVMNKSCEFNFSFVSRLNGGVSGLNDREDVLNYVSSGSW